MSDKTGWIRFKDRLPDKNQHIIIHIEYCPPFAKTYFGKNFEPDLSEESWQPLYARDHVEQAIRDAFEAGWGDVNSHILWEQAESIQRREDHWKEYLKTLDK